MNEKKMVVPEGMLKAAIERSRYSTLGLSGHDTIIEHTVEAALRWLSKNPILPTLKQLNDMYEKLDDGSGGTWIPAYLKEWQTRMFLAPENEDIPEEVAGLQRIDLRSVRSQADLDRLVSNLITAAYKIGRGRR